MNVSSRARIVAALKNLKLILVAAATIRASTVLSLPRAIYLKIIPLLNTRVARADFGTPANIKCEGAIG